MKLMSLEEAETRQDGLDADFDLDDDPRSLCYGGTCGNYALPDDVLCEKCRGEVEVDVAHEEAIIEDEGRSCVLADHDEAKLDDARLALVPQGSIPWRDIVREV